MSNISAQKLRGKALAEAFFFRVDQALKEQYSQKLDREQRMSELYFVTGFRNLELIEHLVNAGFDDGTLAAIRLIPGVMVAWADGIITASEREAILAAMKKELGPDSSKSFELVRTWLENRPSSELWDLWKSYTLSLKESLSYPRQVVLRDELLEQVSKVARASGGLLGLGAISKSEQRVIRETEEVLALATAEPPVWRSSSRMVTD